MQDLHVSCDPNHAPHHHMKVSFTTLMTLTGVPSEHGRGKQEWDMAIMDMATNTTTGHRTLRGTPDTESETIAHYTPYLYL